MREVEASLHQILDSYKSTVLAKDVSGFMALYDDELRVFDMWGAWAYRGAAAWRAMVTDWFGGLGSDRVLVSFDDVLITATAELATIHAFVSYRGLSAEGVELRAMQNRLTLVLRPAGGAWRILHQHSSAPVEPATLRAILQR